MSLPYGGTVAVKVNDFYRATLYASAVYAVVVCPYVCLSFRSLPDSVAAAI